MEFYVKELIDAYKTANNNNACCFIDFRGETLSFDSYKTNRYTAVEQREIIERFLFKYVDLISNLALRNIILDRLYSGDYVFLSTNAKCFLFESLELCTPQQLLPWIYQALDNENEMSKINIQAFTTYVDMKRKRGLTYGEIRYTIICEPSAKLLELILSKAYRDRLTSKQVWLAIFRLKQQLSITNVQKDIFNDWLENV